MKAFLTVFSCFQRKIACGAFGFKRNAIFSKILQKRGFFCVKNPLFCYKLLKYLQNAIFGNACAEAEKTMKIGNMRGSPTKRLKPSSVAQTSWICLKKLPPID